jgi:hypothetical protein
MIDKTPSGEQASGPLHLRRERCLDWACDGFGLDVAVRDTRDDNILCPYRRIRCTEP